MKEQEKSATETSPSRSPIEWMRWVPATILALLFLFAVFISARILLVPILGSLALAYMLAPVVNWFERRGWSRSSSVLLTFIGTSLILVLSLFFIVPGLRSQLTKSYHQAQMLMSDYSRIDPLLLKIKQLSPTVYKVIDSQIKRFKDPDEVARFTESAGVWLQGGLFKLVNLTTSILDLLLIPFFVYYLLADSKEMRARIDRLVPPRFRPLTSDLIGKINRVLSSYVRNQLLIALIMGLLYSVGLMVLRVPLGMTLGLLSGLFNFIPYLGTLTGLALSLVFVALDGAGLGRLSGVILVFIIVQSIEGYYLTPKLLGSRLHLHPLWLLAGLVIAGNIFGLIGIILTVPVIAVGKVVFGFLEEIYQQSDFYSSMPSSKTSNLVIDESQPQTSRRAVITTAELRSRIRDNQSNLDD